jgi:hypothetical protein
MSIQLSINTAVPRSDFPAFRIDWSTQLLRLFAAVNNTATKHTGSKRKAQNVEVKSSLCLTEHHAMKTYWGSGGVASRILWPRHWIEVGGQLHVAAALTPRKEPLVPIG